MNRHPFRLTLAAGLVAASLPAADALAQQSASCSRLLTMIDEAGGEIREEFRDAQSVADTDDPNQCSLYVARVVSLGGLGVADGADASAQAEASAQGEEQTSETVEIERQATIEGEVEVTLPDPDVQVEQDPAEIAVRTPPPEVSVSQGQPTITIRQAQPVIRVQMAQPTISVEQPAPEIVITMPEPGVDVATARPEVEVNIPEPRVTVTQGDPQLAVDLDTTVGDDGTESNTRIERNDQDGMMTVTANGLSGGATEPNIRYIDDEQAPRVSVSGAEPQVDYVAAEPDVMVESTGEPNVEVVNSGEPKIMIRQAGEENEDSAAAETGEDSTAVAALAPAETGASAAEQEQRDPREAFAVDETQSFDGAENSVMTVEELDGMDVVNARGEELGEVGRIVRNGNDTYMVVEHGGWFFGLNDKEIALPIADVTIREDNVVLRGLTEDQIEAMPDYDYANEIALEGTDEVTLQRMN